MNDLNRQMAAGAAWMIFLRLAIRGLGFISVVILARLLTPADFGLIALATVIIAALELMSAFSFDVALIQKQGQSTDDYDTAWTITIIFSAITGLILVALAYPAARFYADPRLQPIMYVLAAGTVVEGFQNIGVVAFRKEMDFSREFVFQISKKIISFSVTVPLAFWLRNYWALVAGIIAGKTAGTIVSYMAHPYRARWSTAAWAELFHFSRWLFLNNMLGFLRARASDLIVGKLAGPASLGIFTVSVELSQMPSSELVAPINRAVFPAYAQISGELSRLQQSYIDVVGMIAMLAIPPAIGLAALADVAVPVILGPKWMAAAPLISILGIAGAITTLETNIGAAYLALGRPEILTKLYGFYVALLVALLIPFTYHGGAMGAAWACLAAGVLNIPVYFGAMLRTLRLPVRRFLGAIWRPIVASLVMYVAVSTVVDTARVHGIRSPLLLLVGGVMAGIGVYVVAILALWYVSGAQPGAESAVLRRIAAALKRPSRQPASLT